MKVAIMQPYFFPYIGYYQLINATDTFVIYDNIQYIKGGWINRNRLLINNKIQTFTVPIKNSSSFSKIKDLTSSISAISLLLTSYTILPVSQAIFGIPFITASMPDPDV